MSRTYTLYKEEIVVRYNFLKSFAVALVMLLSPAFTLTTFATPMSYTFSGELSSSGGFSEEYFAEVVIDFDPSFVHSSPGPPGYFSISGIYQINSFTVTSENLKFLGSGVGYVIGDSWGIMDYFEPNITGYVVSPFFSGPVAENTYGSGGSNAHFFYHEDGTEFDSNIIAYTTEIPWKIEGNWGFGSDSGGNGFSLGHVEMIQTLNTAPVPEPATMLLFGTGLVGLVFVRLRRKK